MEGSSGARANDLQPGLHKGKRMKIPWVSVDGNDVIAVFEATIEAVDRAREGQWPSVIEAKTYRTHGHNESEPLYGTDRKDCGRSSVKNAFLTRR